MTEIKSSVQRIESIDLARGMAVFFMIPVHVLITFSNHSANSGVLGMAVGFFGATPAAPVFMALMGMSFYFSRNTDFKTGVLRGFKIILLGYFLNLLRNVLPILAAKWCAPSLYMAVPEDLADFSKSFFELDILQFAGLALILMAVLRELKANKWLLLVLAVAVALPGPRLWGVTVGNPVAQHLLDYLWGNKPSASECIGNFVSFPFFPWFTFVLLGMFLGDTLKNSADFRKTFRRSGIAGLALVALSLPFLCHDFMGYFGDYYHSGPLIMVFHCGFVLAWLGLCQLAVEFVPPNPLFRLLYGWSKDVNRIYMIQWTLIMWAAVFAVGFETLGTASSAVWMLLMLALTHAVNMVWVRATHKAVPPPAPAA
jgi:uncharacterized membrane protein